MSVVDDALPDPRKAGRISAIAFQLQNSIEPWLNRHDWIERAYVNPVSTAYAFSYPWLPLPQLALCLQFELWVFGADKRIDSEATSAAEVASLVRTWTAIADGADPSAHDRPGTTLAELRARLAASPCWPALGHQWQSLLERTFEGMLTEWNDAATLMSTGTGPTFEDYLANSDSCGFRLIRLTDWIASGDQAAIAHVDALSEASWQAQIASRLSNDLRSHEREHDQVDLNAVKLGVPHSRILDEIDRATAASSELIAPLLDHSLKSAVGLKRILEFGNAFYETTDFRPRLSNGGAA